VTSGCGTNVGNAFDFYISPTGSDTNPGTLASPWSIKSLIAPLFGTSTAIAANRAKMVGNKIGVIGDQGSYTGIYATCGSPSMAGSYATPLLLVPEGSAGNPTLVQSCTTGGSAAGPHIAGTTAAVLSGGLTDANNSGTNTGSALIGHAGTTGYVTIRGLEITSCNSFGIGMGSWSTSKTPGLIADSNYVHGMNGNGNNVNPTGITFRGAGAGSQISNNFVTTCVDNSGINRFSAIEIWQSTGVKIKYNSVVSTGLSGELSAGIFIKNFGQYGNSVYNNYVDLSLSVINGNRIFATDEDNSGPSPPYSYTVANNIFVSSQNSVNVGAGAAGVNSAAVAELQNYANNTLVGGSTVLYRLGTALTLSAYNNIFTGLNAGGYGYYLISNSAPKLLDYNSFGTGTFSASFEPDGVDSSTGHVSYSSLAAWQAQIATNQSACVGKEAHSTQHTPGFTNVGTYAKKYQLTAGDAISATGTNPGRIGGVIAGAATDMGAWGGLDTDSGGAIAQIGASWLQS
jgi:hypothetical protein